MSNRKDALLTLNKLSNKGLYVNEKGSQKMEKGSTAARLSLSLSLSSYRGQYKKKQVIDTVFSTHLWDYSVALGNSLLLEFNNSDDQWGGTTSTHSYDDNK